MSISLGDRLPAAQLLQIGEDGPEFVSLERKLAGRRVIVFGLPGAFTPTCSAAHLPSFIRTAAALAEEGIEEILCISVNDPHVMRAWGAQSGAFDAGIAMLADADGAYTRAIGLDYDAPESGMYSRSRRYAMLVEDGILRILHVEAQRGICEVSGGESMLEEVRRRNRETGGATS